MQFLLPSGLWLLALAIPILLLYMLKLRRRPVQVSSTLLWERLLRDRQANTPWQKLRRNLLLLLQLLILAALVLAYARPAVPAPVVASGALVVLLDGSASMNATDVSPNRFEAARKNVQALVDRLPGGSRMTLILAGRTPEVLVPAETDKSLLRAALAKAQPSRGSADWAAAFALASGAAHGSREVTIVIVSDGGLPASGLPALPGEVRYLPVGTSDDNLAISAFALRPGADGPELFAKVSNHGSIDRAVLLSIYFGDRLVTSRRLDLAAGAGQGLTLADLPDTPGIYHARLTGPQGKTDLDALPLDDSAYAIYQAASTRRVLLVSKGNLFLEQALAALPGIRAFRALPGEDGTLKIPEEPFDLYIFDGLAPDPLPAGNLLFVNPPTNPLFNVGAHFDDMSAVRVHESALTRYVDWSGVHVLRAKTIQAPGWAEVLVATPGGPLVFAGETGNRRIAALAFDLRESDLPLQVAYPILFSNLVNYLVPPAPFDAAQSLRPGDGLPILPPPGTEQVAVVLPSGRAFSLPLRGGTLTFTETGELGYYAVNFITGQNSRADFFAVNLFDAAESDISPRETIRAGRADVSARAPGQAGQRELWPWLAGIALLVLLIEWQAYHRRRIPFRFSVKP